LTSSPFSQVYETLRRFLVRRSTAYRVTFGTRGGQLVLKDLAKFCRAHETTFHADPRVHAVLEGRREVFLRIANHMNLTGDELAALYGGVKKDADG